MPENKEVFKSKDNDEIAIPITQNEGKERIYKAYMNKMISEVKPDGTIRLIDFGIASSILLKSKSYGTVGYYPGDTGKLTDEILSEVFDMYKDNVKIVAIGEIGFRKVEADIFQGLSLLKYS